MGIGPIESRDGQGAAVFRDLDTSRVARKPAARKHAEVEPVQQAPSGPPPSCRRAFPRFSMLREVLLTEIDESGIPGPTWACRAVDVCRSGIGLRALRMIHPGRALIIELPDQQAPKPRVFFGRVQHARYIEGDAYSIGVQFEKMPETTAIREWLSKRRVA